MKKVKLLYLVFLLASFGILIGCESVENPVIDENLYVEPDSYKYLARVQDDNGLYGYINEYGTEVIPCEYIRAGDFKQNGLAMVAKSEHECGYIDKDGKEIIPLQYDNAAAFPAGNILGVAMETGTSIENWAFFNCKGEQLTEFEYQYEGQPIAWENSDTVMIVSKSSENNSFEYQYGVIDDKGNEIIPVSDQVIDITKPLGESGLIAVGRMQKNGSIKYGYLNSQNEIDIPFEYEDARNFCNNGLAAVKKNGVWGYIDKRGMTQISFKYEEAEDFGENGLAFVKTSNTSSYINENGEDVLIGEWESGGKFDQYGFAAVSDSSDYYSVINEEGELLLPYEEDNTYFGGRITNYNQNKSILLNYKGEVLLDRGYSMTTEFGDNGWAIVKNISDEKEDNMFCIDNHGAHHLELDTVYSGISAFHKIE